MRRRTLNSLAAMVVLAAVLAVAGCQPSVTSQLEEALPETAVRPNTMPNEVGQDADKVGTQLLDAGVPVRVTVPARSIAASRTAKGGRIVAMKVNPTVVDLKQASRRFVGFKVLSQEPAAGAALEASQAVILTVGAHPGAARGAAWYSTHPADANRKGKASCFDATAGGQTGCHVPSYCNACHFRAIKP